MKIILSPNPYRDKGLRTAQRARRILEESGVETCMTVPFELEGNVELPEGVEFQPVEEAFRGADALICFGGDGTILHAAKDAQAHGIPVLGVNLGSVGFMAELEQDQLNHLAQLARGDFRMEERMMLDVAVRREGRTVARELALNDAVVTKGAVARVIDLDVKADGLLVGRFPGDGIIVATPTGSTAYSMSAGGPIVEPTAQNITITPICPHALTARSFVLEGSRTVSVLTDRHSRKAAYLSVDGGKAFRLRAGDQVELRRASAKARLIRLTGRSFYAVMDQKLGRTDR